MIAHALLGCIYCATNRMLFPKFNFFSTWSEPNLMPKLNLFVRTTVLNSYLVQF
ncbi:hypothetical protein RHGRI_000943 [Rhododendron griersonianum]|uniref:Photosystem II protein K n=1 Tax=Rhododendron griersonianum TaxID=479676 RepID=A0AAV6LLJ7_9ERIC|nr:hypothetical protein RHGRI_000943 [Rhododendron griersonianum]